MIEDALEGVIGKDISADDLRRLSPEQSDLLTRRLAAANPTDDLGAAGAKAWRGDHQLSPKATLLLNTSGGASNIVASALYMQQLVVADPVFGEDSAREVSFSMGELVALRPLVASGAVLLIPTGLGWSFDDPAAAEQRWGSELVEWFEEMQSVLPQGQIGEIAAGIAGGLATAATFDVDTAAVGRYAPMTARGLTSAGLRASKICEVVVPAFGGLSSKDVVAVRENSSVFADVRVALDQVADNIPDDRERAARLGPSIARDILAPAIESLQKEARRSPTLSAATTATWTLAATGIDVATSSISIGTAMTAAAAPIGLFADWAMRLRTKKSERAAVRVLRTFQ